MAYLLLILAMIGIILGIFILNNEQHKKAGIFIIITCFITTILSIALMMYTQNVSDKKEAQEASIESSIMKSVEETSSGSNESDKNSTEISSDEDVADGFDSNYALEDFIQENTSYSDVSVKGTYVSDPYTCVITINDTHDFRVVISNVLEAFHDHADDKLNNFDEINIQVKNDSQTLKTSYPVSTVMYDSGVYRPSKVEGLATQWIIR
ncbi:hypothetical protein [Weissella minor]|nr:hypothetical protein [Weissella minor]